MKPMLDEIATVDFCMSILTQPHFERFERTDDTQPSFSYDDRNSTKMSEPEPQRIDPPPVAQIADYYEDKATNNERYNCDVQRKHDIR